LSAGSDIVGEALTTALIDQKIEKAIGEGPTPNAILGEFLGTFLFASYTVAILSCAYKALKGHDLGAPIDQASTANERAEASQ
jgi:hypothetical protein